MAGEFFDAPRPALGRARLALLAALGITLVLVSCATALERHVPASVAVVEPAPLAVPPAAPLAPRSAQAPPDALAERNLMVPVRGVDPSRLQDNFSSRRGARMHHAIDIMAARGTPVVAADDGRIVRVYEHELGGLCVYQRDPEERFSYYYAHMDAFAAGLEPGAHVKKGQVLGYVGTTGNASPTAPHLHFAIHRLDGARTLRRAKPVNPYPYLRGELAHDAQQVRLSLEADAR